MTAPANEPSAADPSAQLDDSAQGGEPTITPEVPPVTGPATGADDEEPGPALVQDPPAS